LQHYIRHPYLWRYFRGGSLRSWGAKSIGESGRLGEPYLVADGCARIGEGSGSTNVLTGAGVDEAWMTGVQLAEGVLELLREGASFSRENLERAYVRRRRNSWVEQEGRVAERARVGFHRGLLRGVAGMALAGITSGRLSWPGEPLPPREHVASYEEYFAGKIPPGQIERICRECWGRGASVHDALMERAGWPAIEYDGKLMVSHQDAMLVGGKVQAPAGYADHVVFLDPGLCRSCRTRICVEICSGEAITVTPEGQPRFDRDKCVHCGACVWNCPVTVPGRGEKSNIELRAGAGGLHSTEN
jgi:electron-transferring-flavoprotein dehydrogenase